MILKGKRLSILGDSISSYKGISDDASANSTITGNPYYYREPFSVEQTYWKILLDSLGLTLCVNNSWSGGNLSGKEHEFSGLNRAKHLMRDDGTYPEFIIVFMGINDLGRGVSPEIFAADYEAALSTLKNLYGDIPVCCVNIPDRDIRLKKRAELFNEAISNAAKKMGDGFFVADLFSSRLNNDFYYMNTMDGLHPDPDGMKIIAEVIKKAIEEA